MNIHSHFRIIFPLLMSCMAVLQLACSRETSDCASPFGDWVERFDHKQDAYPGIQGFSLASSNGQPLDSAAFRFDSITTIDHQRKRYDLFFIERFRLRNNARTAADYFFNTPMRWVDSSRTISINRLYSDTLLLFASYANTPLTPDTMLIEFELMHPTKTVNVNQNELLTLVDSTFWGVKYYNFCQLRQKSCVLSQIPFSVTP
jgi:hypothetical protein